LSIYLNSPEGHKAILKIVTGTSYIQSILVKNLAELVIPVPFLKIQKDLIDLDENIRNQSRLLNKKMKINESVINTLLNNFTNS